jgi:hypothetical protein
MNQVDVHAWVVPVSRKRANVPKVTQSTSNHLMGYGQSQTHGTTKTFSPRKRGIAEKINDIRIPYNLKEEFFFRLSLRLRVPAVKISRPGVPPFGFQTRKASAV